jgi:geranylgeranyl diphosphate synthase, type III
MEFLTMKTETRPSAPWPCVPKAQKRDRAATSLSEKQSAKRAHLTYANLQLSQVTIHPVYESQLGTPATSDGESSDVDNNNPSPSGSPARFAAADLNFSWTEQEEEAILAPYDYVASNSGKEFRTLVLNAFNKWFQVPPASLAIICDVVRMLHTSSLLIDDIQDNSLLRRGRPVAHSIYGMAQTINTGNYVYFLAARQLNKLPHAEAALDVFISEMLNLHRGQGLELYWRDTLKCPTEDEYLKMVANKTGGLFRMAVRLMQVESPPGAGGFVDCDKLVQLLGLVYQIADDYKNLTAVEYTANKGFCEDLTEGKFSFPVVHSIQSNTEDRRLFQILAQRTTDVDVKRYAVAYMESTGSLQYTKQVVGVLIRRAREELCMIDDSRKKNHELHALLDRLALE